MTKINHKLIKDCLLSVTIEVRFDEIIDLRIPMKKDEKIYPTLVEKFKSKIESEFPYLEINVNETSSDEKARMPEFRFTDENKDILFILYKDFVSITSFNNYRGFSDFFKKFQFAFEEFTKIFNVNKFNRAGLKYQNLILRSYYDLIKSDWSEILSPFVFEQLSNSFIRDKWKLLQKHILLEDEDIKTNLFYKLDYFTGEFKDAPIKENERGCIINIDNFCDNRIIGKEKLYGTFERCNKNNWSIFTESITDKFAEKLEL